MAETTADEKDKYKIGAFDLGEEAADAIKPYLYGTSDLFKYAGTQPDENEVSYSDRLKTLNDPAGTKFGREPLKWAGEEPDENNLSYAQRYNYLNNYKSSPSDEEKAKAEKTQRAFPNAFDQFSGVNPAITPEGELRPEVLEDLRKRAELAQQAIPSSEGEQIQANAYKQIADLYKNGKNPERDLAQNLQNVEKEQIYGHELKPGEEDTGAYRKGILKAEGEKEQAFEQRKNQLAEFEQGLAALQAKYPTLDEYELRQTFSPWYRALIGGLQSIAETNFSPIDQKIKAIRENYQRELNDLVRSNQVSEEKYRLINEQYTSRLNFMEKLSSIEADVYKHQYESETSPVRKANADINYGIALSNLSKAQTAQASARVQLYDNLRAQVQAWANNPRYVATGTEPDGTPKYLEIKSDKPDEIAYVKKELPGLQVAMSAAEKIKLGLSGQISLNSYEYENLVNVIQAYSTQINPDKKQSVSYINFAGVKAIPKKENINDIAEAILAYGTNFLQTYTKKPAMNPLIMANGGLVMPDQPKKR